MKIKANPSVMKSILVAATGFALAVKKEKSIRNIVLCGVSMTVLVLLAKASYMETMMLVFSWMIVTAFEIFNTALEKAMDYASDKEYHPLIRAGKDYAGASVFIASAFALSLSVLILYSRLK